MNPAPVVVAVCVSEQQANERSMLTIQPMLGLGLTQAGTSPTNQ